MSCQFYSIRYPQNRSEKARDVREGCMSKHALIGTKKNRKHGKCDILEASKAPELEKRGVARAGLELVHITKANIKESKPLKRGPCRKGFREEIRYAACNIFICCYMLHSHREYVALMEQHLKDTT